MKAPLEFNFLCDVVLMELFGYMELCRKIFPKCLVGESPLNHFKNYNLKKQQKKQTPTIQAKAFSSCCYLAKDTELLTATSSDYRAASFLRLWHSTVQHKKYFFSRQAERDCNFYFVVQPFVVKLQTIDHLTLKNTHSMDKTSLTKPHLQKP